MVFTKLTLVAVLLAVITTIHTRRSSPDFWDDVRGAFPEITDKKFQTETLVLDFTAALIASTVGVFFMFKMVTMVII